MHPYFPIQPTLYFVITLVFLGYWLAQHDINTQRFIGLLCVVIGFCLWITARIQLGHAFAIRAKANQLVTHGLYRYFRHPIYVFSILTALGIAIFFHTWWLYVLALVLIMLQAWRRRNEERMMLATFGEKYREYQQRTWF